MLKLFLFSKEVALMLKLTEVIKDSFVTKKSVLLPRGENDIAIALFSAVIASGQRQKGQGAKQQTNTTCEIKFHC